MEGQTDVYIQEQNYASEIIATELKKYSYNINQNTEKKPCQFM